MFDKSKLVEVVKKYGVRWAPEGQEWTLASGSKSKFYIDFSRVVMHPEGAYVVSEALLATLWQIWSFAPFTAVGGPAHGADPVLGAIMPGILLSDVPAAKTIRGFTVLKEPKGRGPDAGEVIEGYLEPNDRVVLIEDVTTSGGSVLKAIDQMKKKYPDVQIIRIVSLLDRLAGADEKLKEFSFMSLITLNDLAL